MEVDDVFTDEVIQLSVGIFLPILIKTGRVAALIAQVFERTHIANWCIQPDIEVLAWRIRDFKTEVWGIAGNIPLLQAGFEPFLHFVGDLLLQRAAACPGLQHLAE